MSRSPWRSLIGSQINVTFPDGESEVQTIVEGKAIPPKVIIENEVFPRPHEVYNCRTCRKGRELPQNKISTEDYHFYCTWDMHTHIGPNYNDICCTNWDRKIEKPKKGFNILETGPYDSLDRR